MRALAEDEPPGDDSGETQDLPGAGYQPRHDRCDQLPYPPGPAAGINQHCLRADASNGVARGDFNGDGLGDLAIGVPGEDIRVDTGGGNITNVADAGAVMIIYGTSNGLNANSTATTPAAQFWSQSTRNVPGASEAGDKFGAALAAGNFNGDIYSDLAIGVPGDNVSVPSCPFGLFCTPRDIGAVIVIYGSAQGLSTSAGFAARFFSLLDFREAWALTDDPGGSELGSALAWGDFDGNGVGDLVVGARNYSSRQATVFGTTGFDDIGGVLIIRGVSGTGLVVDGHQFWTQDPLIGTVEPGDRFGSTLAVGDFNGDARSDLAVGVPGEDSDTTTVSAGTGTVNVIYSSGSRLSATGNQEWNRTRGGPLCCLDAGEQFGASLAAGDFNGDGRADLAIGSPFRDGPSNSTISLRSTGQVDVLYGTATGLAITGLNLFVQEVATLVLGSEPRESGDEFGRAMVAGDFNGDGRADLAIGAPGEDVVSTVTGANIIDAGLLHVIYGQAPGGLNRGAGPGAQVWTSQTIGRGLEAGDRFGAALTAWNFGRNQIVPGFPPRVIASADLAIGSPSEDVVNPVTLSATQIRDAGAVFTIYGSANGLTGSGNQVWLQGYDNVPDLPEADDHMGEALY